MINLNVKEVTPAGYSVLVELHKVHNEDDQGNAVSKGGILLESNLSKKEQDSIQVAKIIKFGAAAFKNHESGVNSPEEWGVKVGDYILFDSYCGRKITSNPKDNRRILTDNEIRAIVEIDDNE